MLSTINILNEFPPKDNLHIFFTFFYTEIYSIIILSKSHYVYFYKLNQMILSYLFQWVKKKHSRVTLCIFI